MLRLGKDEIVLSASDLTAAASCEWAVMRRLDAQLGRKVIVPKQDDPMLARVAQLGGVHEVRVLKALEARHGRAVTIERPTVRASEHPDAWLRSMSMAADDTRAALDARAPLIYQGAFFDGTFQGFSDFLVLAEEGEDHPSYEVWDSKLARHAKITAVLQLAAYVDQLQRTSVPASTTARLVLGNGLPTGPDDVAFPPAALDVADVLPVYRDRRRHIDELIAGRIDDMQPTAWNDERYSACGRCEVCEAEVERHEDVLLVAGLTLRQRDRLRTAGIETLSDLKAAGGAEGVPASTFGKLREQAELQLAARANRTAPIPYRVFNRRPIDLLPPADPGDLFFDFEGDPLYEEKGRWGIDYLFGAYGESVAPGTDDATFLALWADDLASERAAFVEFMRFVAERRAAHPGMHVYHYASYEKTHLLSIAARHQEFEEEVDDLLRDGVLVDLLTVVRRSLRVGTDSYSIKSLEPLYMGDEHRTGTKKAADSVEEFARYVDARDANRSDDAAEIRADIEQYNRYDCRSTLKLRDWLLTVREGAPSVEPDLERNREGAVPDPLTVGLLELVADTAVEDRTPVQTAVALAAAAVDFHRREAKRFWQEHFSRLEGDESEWAEQRGVVSIGPGEAVVITDWHKPTPGSGLARILEIDGTVAPGSSLKDGEEGMYVLYDPPFPDVASSPAERRPTMRLGHTRTVLHRPDGTSVLRLTEKLGNGGTAHDLLPMAITPKKPVAPGTVAEAIHAWGERLLEHLRSAPSLDVGADSFRDAAFDVLVRRPPLTPEQRPSLTEEGAAPAILSALDANPRGTIAVQGPPGTGKTFTGARVIAGALQRGWRVGVVAQSHATVENMLDAVVEADVDPSLVGKALKDEKDREPRPWTVLRKPEIAGFLSEPGGRVLGGTAWTFTNRSQVPMEALDLLVVDEAGQYSLANTIAVSLSAKRLLLLGDPQQLPQVTQGSHPEPVDTSALGWLSDGHEVLPEEYGYFLGETWRMVAKLCEPVSRLSYAGRLHPAAGAKVRRLDGVDPGLHPVPVVHTGNNTSSIEEADVVLELVKSLLDGAWTEHAADEPEWTRPLGQDDLIVVAAYNAQVDLLGARLRQAGYGQVQVGTVDRFQGREAAVAIVSLAASSADDVPRGIEFLLMPNRLNVAISRAKWAAYLVHSPALARHLPTNLPALGMLGRFLRLVSE